MNLDELNKKIVNNFNWLTEIGFLGKEVLSGYSFTKTTPSNKHIFGFSYISYETYHLVMVADGFLSFNSVEFILHKKLKKYPNDFHMSDLTFGDMRFPTTDTRNISIYTSEDFEKLVPIWTQDIKEKVLPFFDQWSNLKKINDEIINKISRQELPNYIPGETSFKKMIIMKLCNNPDYLSYISEREHILFNAMEKDKKKYEPYYNLFMELKAELENTPPLYL
ncbi:MAG: hypothetical protein P1P88_01580 [Bacteroidales bacterium]|nr:hypothetical protein [Bacteroidales bacterium]